MIVRDSADFIEETLNSVVDLIDTWVIVDTGSLDNTMEVIRSYFATRGIAGTLAERPWVGFAHNRTEALALSRGHGDYAFMVDADDVMVGSPNFTTLTEPGYLVKFGPNPIFWRTALFRLDCDWEFRGVVHEYAVESKGFIPSQLDGDYHFIFRSLGNRSKDPQKFQRDIDVLLADLVTNPDDRRSYFYLGQSYRNLGEPEPARHWYKKCAELPGWNEETFVACLEVAKLEVVLKYPTDHICSSFEKAWRERPTRCEALVELASFHRTEGRWLEGFEAAQRALDIPFPGQDYLFVDFYSYEWRALDEFAICASQLGHHEIALSACNRLLSKNLIPTHERDRVLWNQTYSMMQLGYPNVLRTEFPPNRQEGPTAHLTFTITTSRRLDLFERTIDALILNCLDHHLISRWICIDDGSSISDRHAMQERYPFFEFIFKDDSDQGHANSMNQLLAMVDTEFWFHCEDDWQFVKSGNHISAALDVLKDNEEILQTIFNRNYAEALEDHNLLGGQIVESKDSHFAYRLHSYMDSQSDEFWELFRKTLGGRTNAHWPGFSLMPSVLRRSSLNKVGAFNPGSGHFEREMALALHADGSLISFLDDITMLNIGKMRKDKSESAPANAYQLLGVEQFSTYPQISVRLLPNWCSSGKLVNLWARQFPTNASWKGMRFVSSGEDADFDLVINHPGSNIAPDHSKTLLVHMEPMEGLPLFGQWGDPANDGVLHFHSREFASNFLEWHLDSNFEELITNHPDKSKDFSTVVSGKRLSPGHHLRLDFIHHLEELGVPIDIFGSDNDEKFNNYQGSLPQFAKDAGLFLYRYTLAVENNSEQNYVTEKLVDGILAECLVFYWGCPNISEFIDPDAYIVLPLDNFARAAQIVTESIATNEYEKRLGSIRRAKRAILNDLQLVPEVSRLVRGQLRLSQTPVHLINLERRPDRLRATLNKFTEKSNSQGLENIQLFPAVDGAELVIDEAIQHMFRGSELPLRPAQTACALSHLALWFELMNGDSEWCLILEDDVSPLPHFTSRLRLLLGQIEDKRNTDLVFLGLHYSEEHLYPDSSVQKLIALNTEGVIGGTFGYLISQQAAKILLGVAHTQGIPCGIDTFILQHLDKIRCTEAVPHLLSSPVARRVEQQIDSDIQYE